MSTVLHPVGPQPSRVYWLRRVVVAGALVVVIALVWALVSGTRSSATGEDDAAGEEDLALVDDADAADTVEDGAAGPTACAPADLSVTLTTDTRTYPAPNQPLFTVGVTNAGASSCTLDLGPGAWDIVVTSGTDRIWSTADCRTEATEELLLLPAGARESRDLSWPRVRSAEGCTADLPEPLPGTYSAVVTVLGTQSAAAVFDLA